MSDLSRLILIARLRMLERSLTAVAGAMASIELKRKDMRELVPTFATNVYELLKQVDTKAELLRDRFQGSDAEEDVGTAAEDIRQATFKVRTLIREFREAAPSYGPVQVAWGQDFDEGVGTLLADVTTKLETVKSTDKAIEIKQAWEATPGIFAESEKYFAEYVQLLAGVALRDTGLDEGIPEVADLVLRDALSSRSLTVPSHKQPLEPTLAALVHLGYPEWSPWALPLAVSEVARMELQRGSLAKHIAAKVEQGFEREDLINCLSDMIGTFVVGPAYVWARMLIEFDPAAGYVQQVRVVRSFRAMVTTLRSMDDPKARTQTSFGNIAERLEDAWNEATREVGAINPTQEERKAAGKDVNDVELAAWRAQLKGYNNRRLLPSDWATIKEGAQALRSEDAEEAPWVPPNSRVVLNAAWLARVDAGMDRSGDDQPLEQLAERATEAMRKVANLPVRKKRTPGAQAATTRNVGS